MSPMLAPTPLYATDQKAWSASQAFRNHNTGSIKEVAR
jgi:hypothetical protein